MYMCTYVHMYVYVITHNYPIFKKQSLVVEINTEILLDWRYWVWQKIRDHEILGKEAITFYWWEYFIKKNFFEMEFEESYHVIM